MKCPHCERPGEKHIIRSTVVQPNGLLGSKYGSAICSTCGGTNEITDDHARAIELGSKLRYARIQKARTTRQQAHIIGCSPSHLSHVEAGHITDENRGLAEELWELMGKDA